MPEGKDQCPLRPSLSFQRKLESILTLPRKAKIKMGPSFCWGDVSFFPVRRHFLVGHYFPACSALRICASTAASAVMLTTRRGVEAGVSTCAGWSMPIRIGPIATPSVITRTML